jgi:hypothetical protein
VAFEGNIFCWEHFEMITVSSYREGFDRRKAWYEMDGFLTRLFTSGNGPDARIDTSEINPTASRRIRVEME